MSEKVDDDQKVKVVIEVTDHPPHPTEDAKTLKPPEAPDEKKCTFNDFETLESIEKAIFGESCTVSEDIKDIIKIEKEDEKSPTPMEVKESEEDPVINQPSSPLSNLPIEEWSASESLLFYRAMTVHGFDINIMQKLFPNKSTEQLELKLKAEEQEASDLVRDIVPKGSQYKFEVDRLVNLFKGKPATSTEESTDQDTGRHKHPAQKLRTSPRIKQINTNNPGAIKKTTASKRRNKKTKGSSSCAPESPNTSKDAEC